MISMLRISRKLMTQNRHKLLYYKKGLKAMNTVVN